MLVPREEKGFLPARMSVLGQGVCVLSPEGWLLVEFHLTEKTTNSKQQQQRPQPTASGNVSSAVSSRGSWEGLAVVAGKPGSRELTRACVGGASFVRCALLFLSPFAGYVCKAGRKVRI